MNSLLVRIGFRMHSRLREMCEFLEYDGPDYRFLRRTLGPTTCISSGTRSRVGKLPARTSTRARAQLGAGKRELGWSGGKAST